jgi:hypothetical protein
MSSRFLHFISYANLETMTKQPPPQPQPHSNFRHASLRNQLTYLIDPPQPHTLPYSFPSCAAPLRFERHTVPLCCARCSFLPFHSSRRSPHDNHELFLCLLRYFKSHGCNTPLPRAKLPSANHRALLSSFLVVERLTVPHVLCARWQFLSFTSVEKLTVWGRFLLRALFLLSKGCDGCEMRLEGSMFAGKSRSFLPCGCVVWLVVAWSKLVARGHKGKSPFTALLCDDCWVTESEALMTSEVGETRRTYLIYAKYSIREQWRASLPYI